MTTKASLLRWTFIRKEHVITCEITVNGSQSYDVSVVPHWDVSASAVESYDRPAAALRRHAELAWYFREDGWALLREPASQHAAAA